MKHDLWEECKQSIEHFGKHPTNRNSAHRTPSTVFFNSSNGTTIAGAVNVQHISIFGICEDVRHFTQHYYNVTLTSHNGQLTLHTDSHSSDSGAVRREERKILGAKSKLQYSEIALSLQTFGIGHMYIYTLLIMTDTVTSQNIDLASWDTQDFNICTVNCIILYVYYP